MFLTKQIRSITVSHNHFIRHSFLLFKVYYMNRLNILKNHLYAFVTNIYKRKARVFIKVNSAGKMGIEFLVF